MSYRIAHVRFKPGEKTYPVNCFRADVNVGDIVVVETPNRTPLLKEAQVDAVSFLNWNCANSIRCLASEMTVREDGSYKIDVALDYERYVHSVEQLRSLLDGRGWTLSLPKNNGRIRYSLSRADREAAIFFRKNGIDFRLECEDSSGTESEVRWAYHYYYESGIDLLQFSISFADAFAEGQVDLSEYFVAKGRKFPRVRWPADGDDLSVIYDALSDGSGGGVYLSEGVWLGKSGRLWDE